MPWNTRAPEQTLAWGHDHCTENGGGPAFRGKARDEILDAVRLNWRLWTIIQAEQYDPDCTTEKSIREGLLNLSNFVDKRSLDLLARPNPTKLEVLINVNRNIAAGLLGTDLTPEQRQERDRRLAKQQTHNLNLQQA